MEKITKKDCEDLYKTFIEYCNTENTVLFPFLVILDLKIQYTIEHYDETPQEELQSMFRAIDKLMSRGEKNDKGRIS